MTDNIHEFTIKEFKQEIESIYKSIKHSSYPQNDILCKTVRGKECFEEIRISTGEKILLPVSYPYFFLFRGQNKEYSPCLPSLYRQDLDKVALFIEKLRFYTFKQLLDTHPIVDGFFKVRGYKIDYEGLAQHYGMKTHVLDFTSDLDVALFFATCLYDTATDTYQCYNDKKIHHAILYLVNPILNDDLYSANEIQNILENRITCIGLQPFARPGAQKGFSYHCTEEDKSLKAPMYKIRFTSNDSRKYFANYQSGERLWIHDELVPKAKAIQTLTKFTRDAYIQCYKGNPEIGMSINDLEIELSQRGINVNERQPQVYFSTEELQAIIRRWDNEVSEQFSASIFHRNTIMDNKKYDSMSSEQLAEMLLLDIIGSDFRFPHKGVIKGYNPSFHH